jgi:hypothetical protein
MSSKITVALLVLACAGCGAHPHNVVVATPNAVQANRAASTTETGAPLDAILIEQACYAFSECRTTASGLGV